MTILNREPGYARTYVLIADSRAGCLQWILGAFKWKYLTDAFLSLLKSVNQLSRGKKGGRSYGADD